MEKQTKDKFEESKAILIEMLPLELQYIIQERNFEGLFNSKYNPEIQDKDSFKWVKGSDIGDYSHLRFIVKFNNKYYKVYWTRYKLNEYDPIKEELWEKIWEVIPNTTITTIYNPA